MGVQCYDIAMTADEVRHLADLARIEIAQAEAAELASEFDAILSYVAAVQEISAGTGSAAPVVPAHHNILREDIETHEPGAYTDALLAQAPQRAGRHVQVKQILGNNNDGS